MTIYEQFARDVFGPAYPQALRFVKALEQSGASALPSWSPTHAEELRASMVVSAGADVVKAAEQEISFALMWMSKTLNPQSASANPLEGLLNMDAEKMADMQRVAAIMSTVALAFRLGDAAPASVREELGF